MNLESGKLDSNDEPKNDYDLSFELDTSRPGVNSYVFNNVIVGIDRSGKNIQDVPEVLFGVYEGDSALASMDQPDESIKGVNMDYVAACVTESMKAEEVSEVWFHPYGDDGEDADNRMDARARLFTRYFNIQPGPDDYGYIIRV